jgi:hypothetical protein
MDNVESAPGYLAWFQTVIYGASEDLSFEIGGLEIVGRCYRLLGNARCC